MDNEAAVEKDDISIFFTPKEKSALLRRPIFQGFLTAQDPYFPKLFLWKPKRLKLPNPLLLGEVDSAILLFTAIANS